MIFQQLDRIWPQWLSRHGWPLGIACLVCAVAGFLNWQFPVVRLMTAEADHVALTALLLLPWLALVLLARSPRGPRYGVGLVLAIALLPFGSCLAVVTAVDLACSDERHLDRSFVPTAHVMVGASDFVLYQSDCGATCNFGLVLRQERTLVPHVLKLVRDLGYWYPAQEGTVTADQAGRVHLHIAASRESGTLAPDAVILVRPWLYF